MLFAIFCISILSGSIFIKYCEGGEDMSERRTNIDRRHYSYGMRNKKYYYTSNSRNADMRKYKYTGNLHRNGNRSTVINDMPKKGRIVLSRKHNDWRKSYKPVYETNVKYVFKPFVLSDDVIEYILNL